MQKLKIITLLITLISVSYAKSAVLISQKTLSLAEPVAKTVTVPTDKTIMLQNFTGIIASGTLNYRIIVGGKSNYLQLQGDPKVLDSLKYTVDQQKFLHLAYPTCSNQELQITIHVAQLNRIKQTGSGSVYVNYLKPEILQVDKFGIGNLFIKGKVQLAKLDVAGGGNISIPNIRAENLFMNISTAGVIRLHGVVNIAQLNFSGTGDLRMYWVESGILTVNTYGSGTVALAGIAITVNANAHDHSHLDLRFVRAKTMFVKSFEYASVDVWAEKNLFAFSRNNSNIYYYNRPGYRSRMMEENGSVLPMWNVPGAITTFNTKGAFPGRHN